MRMIARVKYKSYDWAQPFDPDEYGRNPKAITMLYENWLQSASDLEAAREEVEVLQRRVNELDKSNALLVSELDFYERRKWVPFILQLLAVIFAGIGINLLTGETETSYGWIFLVVSVILEVVAFFMLKSEA